MRVWLAVGLLSISCRVLPELERNSCGNGVVEPLEDCDLFADTSLQPSGRTLLCGQDDCRYHCGAPNEMDAPVCPAGWFCGEDLICRQASDRFVEAESSPINFNASELLVGDMDGDGIDDLIGGETDRIEVRYGAGDGTFREPFSILVDVPLGQRTIFNTEADGPDDVLIPYLLGVNILLGDTTRRLIPDAHPPIDLTELGLIDEAQEFRIASGRTAERTVLFGVVVIDGEVRIAGPSNPPSLGMPAGRLVALEVGDVLGVFPGEEVVLGFAESRFLSVGNIANGAGREVDIGGALTDAGVVLVDMDGDGQEEILANAGGQAKILSAPDFTAVQDLRMTGFPLAGARDGDRVLLVFPDTVETTTSAVDPIELVYDNRLEPWSHAVFLDVDGDGALDVAAANDEAVNVTFLRSRDDLFNRVDVATKSPPQMLSPGDFDGDGVGDLALVLRGEEQDEVHVIYGARDGSPTAPILMARFHSVLSIRTTEFTSPVPPNMDAIDDLLVEVVEAGTAEDHKPTDVAVLIGTGRRRMHSPVFLDPENGEKRPFAVTGGSFGTPRDLAVLTTDGFIGLVGGRPGGRFAEPSFAAAESCGLSAADFTNRCATLIAADTSGAGDDLVLASRSGRCAFSADTATIAVFNGTSCSSRTVAKTLIRHVAADLDQNGRDDLILLFAADGATAPVVRVLNDNMTASALAPLVKVDGTWWEPFDITPLGRNRIAVLTSEGAITATVDLSVSAIGTFTLEASRSIPASGRPRITTAQIDGDGLDDLLFGTNEALYLFKGVETFVGGDVIE